MGLDVYLYKYSTPIAEVQRVENEYEARTTAAWDEFCGPGKYDEIPEENKEKYRVRRAEIAREMGLDDDGSHPGKDKIEIDSVAQPDHLFKIGYLRSSYNGGGFNSQMEKNGLPTLGDIFGNEDGDYEFAPDWEASRARAVEALAARRSSYDGLSVFEISGGLSERTVANEAEALKVTREKIKSRTDKDDMFQSFGCREGRFDLGEPLRVVGLVLGKPGFLGTGVYVVNRDSGEEGDWYAKALEIVIETIDYVMVQPDREAYLFHWSG